MSLAPYMVDCTKCRELFSPVNSNGRIRPTGFISRTVYNYKGKRHFIVDICDLCGGSMRVAVGRAYPMSDNPLNREIYLKHRKKYSYDKQKKLRNIQNSDMDSWKKSEKLILGD